MRLRHSIQVGALVLIGFPVLICAQAVSNDGPPGSHQISEVRLPCSDTGGQEWQPGLHYNVLLPLKPTYVVPGKVQIIELSMYTSSVAWVFRPHLKQWLEKQAGVVEYVRKPSIDNAMPHARLQARMFFTLEELGRSDLHEKFEDWVADAKRWPIYHNIWHPDDREHFNLNVEFAKLNGISENKFANKYYSGAIDDKVHGAERRTSSYHVDGTPTFVINGRYSTSLQRLTINLETSESVQEADTNPEFGRLIALLEYLVTDELHEKCKPE